MGDFFYNASLKVLPGLFMGVTRLLYATCRREVIGQEYKDRCVAGGAYILAFWHYGVYYIIHQTPGETGVAMVSASRDGEYIARVMHRIDFVTVRGSRGRDKGGFRAMLQMIPLLKEGRTGAIVVDGSQGPARVAQPGAVILASKTGVPILPVGWAADRYHAFGSWDRSILPKPFARITLGYGEPLTVPAGVRGPELEAHRLRLEQSLNDLYQQCWQRFGREEH